METGPAGTVASALESRDRTHWLEPIPDALALPSDASPFELTALRQSIRLAFVAALQHLPPRQRAVLILTEVLGWSAAESAECLEMSVAAVNSALQRARATLDARRGNEVMPTLDDDRVELLNRYVEAFQSYDVDALVATLRHDATFSMPPYALWLQGPESVRGWLLGPGHGCRGSRLVPTQASGAPAFGQYRCAEEPGVWKPWALVVLEVADGAIAEWNSFLDTETLFPKFGLPMELRAEA